MTDRVGQHLGNYHFIRLLGKGGFAEVYLGEHVYLETQAAIKVLLTQLAFEDIEPFRVEAKRVAHLEHPHIVRVLDFGVDGTTPYLVMSYAPNGTLRKLHPKGMALPLPTILSYVKQAADALQYAHDEHFIHRDVKPENLLVGRRQEILLSDFGIALLSQTSRSQSIQDVAGTASYMAPEQFQGKPRPASDQYSLGITVYEWLTGDCPFHGSFTEVASQHLFVPAPPFPDELSSIPPAVEQVVLTALAKDPHQRFASVQAFATAFEQASQVQPTVTILASHSSQPTELATAPNETLIPTELVTPPNQSALLPTIYARSSPPPPTLPPQRASVSPSPGTLLCTYRGHSDGLLALAWSPDGRRIASGGADNTVQVWDATTGKTLFTYRGHSAVVYGLGWSPDGKRIASGGADNTVQVWDAAKGKTLLTYRGHSNKMSGLGWSPDGRRIASGSDDTMVQVWDAASGKTLLTCRGHSDWITALAWSPNGRRIASGSLKDPTMLIWDADSGKPLLTYQSQNSDGVYALAWSPDGRHFASGGIGGNKKVQVWDAASGKILLTYQGYSDSISPVVRALAWSPNGKYFASAGDIRGMAWVWQV